MGIMHCVRRLKLSACKKIDSETGLRNPTILEAQSADKTLMTITCDLVTVDGMEKGWNL